MDQSSAQGAGQMTQRSGEKRRKFFKYPHDTQAEETVTTDGDCQGISKTVSKRILNEQDLIAQCEIDTNVWSIEPWTCAKKEAIVYGELRTTFQVKVWLNKRVDDIPAGEMILSLIEDAKAFAPKYPKIKYPTRTDGYVYEIDRADLVGPCLVGDILLFCF
jgi:hypothetical protein